MRVWVLHLLALVGVLHAKPSTKDKSREPMNGFVEGDTGMTDWWLEGQEELLSAIDKTNRINQQIVRAKNIILFIGDGMGVSTVSAARIFHAQSRNLTGYDAHLAFENFPHLALSKTYNTDAQVPDSAATATAFTTGYKAKIGTVGVNQNVYRRNCTNTMANSVTSYIGHAAKAGKWTGVVTTTRLTHATPAATYAHSGDRDWESDLDRNYDVPNEADRQHCPDIAYQLIHNEDNRNIRVLMGGGRYNFMLQNQTDPEYPTYSGKRINNDLIQDWLDIKAADLNGDTSKYKYVYNQSGFDDADENKLEYLLGVFERSHMLYESARTNEPSLAEMTTKAIKMLQRSPEGFALLVEGGRIDHAHHDNKAANSLRETVSLSDAVKAAMSLTDEADTLIVVSADHSHVFVMNGYPYINNNILGLVREENTDHSALELAVMDDQKPFLTLMYTNGPGFEYHRMVNNTEVPRKDLVNDTNIGNPSYDYDAGMWVDSETHGGEDVAIYARGPMSHLFHGVHEQNYIAHVLMYAACVGPNTDHCNKPRQFADCPAGCATIKPQMAVVLTLLLYFIY